MNRTVVLIFSDLYLGAPDIHTHFRNLRQANIGMRAFLSSSDPDQQNEEPGWNRKYDYDIEAIQVEVLDRQHGKEEIENRAEESEKILIISKELTSLH